MSEIGEYFKALKEHHREQRDEQLPGRRVELKALTGAYRVTALNSDFDTATHYRVTGLMGTLDIWPSRNRFNWIKPAPGVRYNRGSIQPDSSITEYVGKWLTL